jgi:hypothetical protein
MLVTSGKQGPKGDKGDIGLTGTAGQGYTWLGEYSPIVTYHPYDSVMYSGSSYICISESVSNVPTDATYWELLASKTQVLKEMQVIQVIQELKEIQEIQELKEIQDKATTGWVVIHLQNTIYLMTL